MSVDQIEADLYERKPSTTLFHYTALKSLEGITQEKCLWATDIHYFNDAAEMRHIVQLLSTEIDHRIDADTDDERVLLQLREWLAERLPEGNMVFVTSFTESGNLLSQWRGYCLPGQGVSLGLEPVVLERCAVEQSFQVGRCIYERDDQLRLASRLIDAILELAHIRGAAPPNKKHPSQSFHAVFEEIENALLRIGALVKHPSFGEEKEWRAVSPALTNYVETPIRYRAGASMLVPFINFSLLSAGETKLHIQYVFLGPTPNVSLSMNSLSRMLAKHVTGGFQVQYCGIPYRTW